MAVTLLLLSYWHQIKGALTTATANSARSSHFLAHFIVVTLRPQREICFRKVWKTQIDDNYFFSFWTSMNPMNPTPNSPTLVILNEMAWSQRLRKRKSISPLIRTFSLSSQWTTATATNQRHSYSYEGCSKKKTFPLYNYKNDATELYFLSSPMVTLNSIKCASSTAHSQ